MEYTIEQLQAHAYKLIVTIQKSQIELQAVENEIEKKIAEEVKSKEESIDL